MEEQVADNVLSLIGNTPLVRVASTSVAPGFRRP